MKYLGIRCQNCIIILLILCLELVQKKEMNKNDFNNKLFFIVNNFNIFSKIYIKWIKFFL